MLVSQSSLHHFLQGLLLLKENGMLDVSSFTLASLIKVWMSNDLETFTLDVIIGICEGRENYEPCTAANSWSKFSGKHSFFSFLERETFKL